MRIGAKAKTEVEWAKTGVLRAILAERRREESMVLKFERTNESKRLVTRARFAPLQDTHYDYCCSPHIK